MDSLKNIGSISTYHSDLLDINLTTTQNLDFFSPGAYLDTTINPNGSDITYFSSLSNVLDIGNDGDGLGTYTDSHEITYLTVDLYLGNNGWEYAPWY